MLDAICRGMPREVEVGGARVPIRTGWRAHALVDAGELSGAEAMWALFARDGALPEAVSADPEGAMRAAGEWHARAWDNARHGRPRQGQQARTFDWRADADLVVADFQALYRIDLTDPATQMHWWRMVALLCGAMRSEGSLLCQAVSARSPMPPGVRGRERDRLRRLADAWALPPTEQEMLARLRERF